MNTTLPLHFFAASLAFSIMICVFPYRAAPPMPARPAAACASHRRAPAHRPRCRPHAAPRRARREIPLAPRPPVAQGDPGASPPRPVPTSGRNAADGRRARPAPGRRREGEQPGSRAFSPASPPRSPVPSPQSSAPSSTCSDPVRPARPHRGHGTRPRAGAAAPTSCGPPSDRVRPHRLRARCAPAAAWTASAGDAAARGGHRSSGSP